MKTENGIPLLPCPFCGSRAIALNDGIGVHCKQCHAQGPIYPVSGKKSADALGRTESYEAWNRRVECQKMT
jgi:hypothetical protein